MVSNAILLISVYNPKSLSVKHIETALTYAGYDVSVIYFKNINFSNPKSATDKEFELLKTLVREKKPLAIGLSVMASFFMETIELVNNALKSEFDIPIVWGGIYPTMFADKCMESADFVIRGEGEEAFIELADTLKNFPRGKQEGDDAAIACSNRTQAAVTESDKYAQIKNLVYRKDDGSIVSNDLRDLMVDLDKFGLSVIGNDNKYLIDNDTVTNRDPLLDAYCYDTSGSRGCPNACSFCCSGALKRITAGKGKAVRVRKPDKLIEELVHAKSKMRKLKYIRFYDEIFPDDEAWIDEFIAGYKKKINLPFEIWGHPMRVKEVIMKKLVSIGLYKITVGMQTGSPFIRKEIFNRPEKQENIINASKALVNAKVPDVVYDLMVRHCFETHETLRETLQLCLELKLPFALQMHGLNYLPGTPIVQKALDMNFFTPEEMDNLMHAPVKEQYAMYWKHENSDAKMNYIYKLLFLTQLSCFRKTVKKLADPNAKEDYAKVDMIYKLGVRLARARHIYKKLVMLGRGAVKRVF